MPDNYDAFIRHESVQQEYLESLPKCDKCDEPIQDDYLFDIGGDIYCEECMNDEFRVCTDKYIREGE